MLNKYPYDFCLLIPCYNNKNGLIQSLNSVKYSEGNYQIVIIDDGSDVPVEYTDPGNEQPPTRSVLILRNDINQGITVSLNKGLKWIISNKATSYIARLDCGDTCSADRFTKQVQYMKNHSSVGLLGSWVRFCEPTGRGGYSYTTPVSHPQLIRAMHLRNVFIHPSVIIRLDVLEKFNLLYPENFPHAEDYAFFWSIIQVSHSHILNEFLVTCEINKNGISYKNRQIQLQSRYKVVRQFGKSSILKKICYFYILTLRLIPLSILENIKKFMGKK